MPRMRKVVPPLFFLILILSGCSPRSLPQPELPVNVLLYQGQRARVSGEKFLVVLGRRKFRLSSPVVFYAQRGRKYYSLDLGEVHQKNLSLSGEEFLLKKGETLHLFHGRYSSLERAREEISKLGEGVVVVLWEKESKGIRVKLGKKWYEAEEFRVLPESGFLSLEGKKFRGNFLIRETARGLEVINRLGIEKFLKGCGEGWKNLPLEAAKALTLVLRTNALARGFPLRAEDFGYTGLEGERADFSKAVDATRGLVLLYGGKLRPIPYTLSCGGETEDLGLPYLRRFRCWQRARAVLTSDPPHYSPGLSILEALGILVVEDEDGPLSQSQAQQWLWNFSRFVSAPKFYPVEGEGKRAFLMALGRTLMKLKPGETPEPLEYLLDASIINEDDLREDKITQGDAASFLYSSLAYLKAVPWHRGRVKVIQGKVTVDGHGVEEPILFRVNKQGIIPASVLLVFHGEEISYLKGPSGEISALMGDGFSGAGEELVWRKRYSLDSLKARLNYFFPVGEVQNLTVKERYPSGRVKFLEVEGEREFYILNEEEIRKFLALPSTWFFVDREYDEDGNLEGLFFIGVGKGSGAGLCLMGARRMALEGENFRRILSRFYKMEIKGVEIAGKRKRGH